jgi:hypothetical protein
VTIVRQPVALVDQKLLRVGDDLFGLEYGAEVFEELVHLSCSLKLSEKFLPVETAQ